MKFHQISALAFSALAIASQADSDTNAASESYTLWFVVFNQPSNCVGSPCGIRDVFGDDFLASIDAGSPDPSLIAPNSAVRYELRVSIMLLSLLCTLHASHHDTYFQYTLAVIF